MKEGTESVTDIAREKEIEEKEMDTAREKETGVIGTGSEEETDTEKEKEIGEETEVIEETETEETEEREKEATETTEATGTADDKRLSFLGMSLFRYFLSFHFHLHFSLFLHLVSFSCSPIFVSLGKYYKVSFFFLCSPSGKS